MAKLKEQADSKVEKSPTVAHSSRRAGRRWRPSVALIVAFLGVLAVGILLGATRELRTEVAALKAINECEATAWASEDGLSDAYGLVQFRLQRAEVAAYLSLCETNPKLALRVFRQALDKGNTSGKLVAMYSAAYLTAHKQLEDSDFQRILAQLKPEVKETAPSPNPLPQGERQADLRKVAQRVVSDLTVIDDTAHPSRYEVVPAGLPPPAKGVKDPESEPRPHKVQTGEEKLQDSGQAVLYVRWSSPDVALKWWEDMAAKGRWDKDLQRFVISSAQ